MCSANATDDYIPEIGAECRFEENSDDSVLKAVYLDPFEAKLVGLGHIATYYKSKKVIDFLRSSPSFADGPDRFTEGIKV